MYARSRCYLIRWSEKDPITLINLHPLKNNPNPRLDIFVENKSRYCSVISVFKRSFKGMKDKTSTRLPRIM
jgi:hypothetical protein